MSITETATRNHDKWFPGHTSTLKVSDPEFIETFDNFAFDEVLAQVDLDDRTRMMTILAALIAAQAFSEFKVLVGAALIRCPDGCRRGRWSCRRRNTPTGTR